MDLFPKNYSNHEIVQFPFPSLNAPDNLQQTASYLEDYETQCISCGELSDTYQCADCFDRAMLIGKEETLELNRSKERSKTDGDVTRIINRVTVKSTLVIESHVISNNTDPMTSVQAQQQHQQAGSSLTKQREINVKCQVCGAQAENGLHYGLKLCSACTLFVYQSQRNNTYLDYKCLFNSDCIITEKTRAKCKYCRYQRYQMLLVQSQSKVLKTFKCPICEQNQIILRIFYGALSCISCASFFENIVRKCVILSECSCRPDAPFPIMLNCRLCRYSKCIQAGMDESKVTLCRIDESNKCQICGEQSQNGLHFGLNMCVACASFIQKSKLNGKYLQYYCNYNSNCIITEQTRANCKYCRYMCFQRLSSLAQPERPKAHEAYTNKCPICKQLRKKIHHNYGAISCNSCAYFFSTHVKDYGLVQQAVCICTNEKRFPHVLCQHCRFQRCLEVGMDRSKVCVPKIGCGVCSSKLLPRTTYGVILCRACRVFIKNATQNKKIREDQCSTRGKCEVSYMSNEKICSYCRYQKFLSIGGLDILNNQLPELSNNDIDQTDEDEECDNN